MRRWAFLSLVLLGCSSSSSDTSAPAESAPQAPEALLSMNDVSVLWPLPASPDAPGYLKPNTKSDRGALLPKAIFDQIPTFPVYTEELLEYPRMRVIAARFDGCFGGPELCEPQIRLVMQPIKLDGSSADSALHLFYRLTPEEMAEVVTSLRALHALAPEVENAPLDVHPALVKQGVEGPYGAALRDLVMRFCGEQNFRRMTFFLRAPPQVETWFFGGFEVKGGALEQLDIVGVGKSNQRVIHTETPGGYDYDLLPQETKPESTQALMSTEKAKSAPRADLEATLAAFMRIENPDKYGPDQLPCAGCHLSTMVTTFAHSMLGTDATKMPESFASSRDLTLRGASTTTPSSLRAFGWHKSDPMIARRVVFETARVLDDLEARFPAKR